MRVDRRRQWSQSLGQRHQDRRKCWRGDARCLMSWLGPGIARSSAHRPLSSVLSVAAGASRHRSRRCHQSWRRSGRRLTAAASGTLLAPSCESSRNTVLRAVHRPQGLSLATCCDIRTFLRSSRRAGSLESWEARQALHICSRRLLCTWESHQLPARS